MKTLEEIAQSLDGRITHGDPKTILTSVQPLDNASEGALSFITKSKYLADLEHTKASAILIAPAMLKKANPPADLAIVEVARPYVAFARAAQIFAPKIPQPEGIHPSAVIDETAKVHEGVSIGPFAYVGPKAEVGEGAVLYPGVHLESGAKVGPATVLYNHAVVRHDCQVGSHCIIHPGVVIGSDGFGFAQQPAADPKDLDNLEHIKIPQVGNVLIEDHVEIGSNSCVDRGALGSTVIRAGTKIDNLVQIGHNVELGRNCILVAQSGVAGSSRLRPAVTLAAQAGIAGHLEIGEGALVLGQAGVAQNVAPGDKVMGTPAIAASSFLRNSVHFAQLNKMQARIKKLEKSIQAEEE